MVKLKSSKKAPSGKSSLSPPPKDIDNASDSDSEPDLPKPITTTTPKIVFKPTTTKSQQPIDVNVISKDIAKKRKAEDSDDNKKVDASELSGTDLVNVEFEINALKESDFHGIKCLLQQLFWKDMNTHLSELTELILAQWEYVGSALKVKTGDDVYGVMSCINMHEHKDKECIQALKGYLLDKVDAIERAKWQQIFDDESKGLGLLINERFINVPFQVVGPLHNILNDEIKESVEDDHQPFQFDNYLVISKTFKEAGSGGTLPKVKKSKKGKKSGFGSGMNYVNMEEEYFAQAATMKFHFGVDHSENETAKAALGDIYLLMGRHVLLVPITAIPALLTQVEKMTAE